MNFDPQAFLDATFTDANSTELIPMDEGEYPATINEVKVDEWAKKDGSAKGLKLVLTYEVLDEAQKAKTKRTKLNVRQDIMLDLAPSGGLDMGEGKNVTLGKLRAAVGKNRPGESFSFRMLVGCTVKVRVGLRDHEGRKFEEVRAVAAA